jgi:hypothetical protein
MLESCRELSLVQALSGVCSGLGLFQAHTLFSEVNTDGFLRLMSHHSMPFVSQAR